MPLPLRRELRKPYFLLRTPDGLGNYLAREIARALFSKKDPLTRFLVAAQLTGPQVKPPAIEFDLEGRAAEEFAPLDHLADAEIAAFEAGARDFLAKAEPTADRVTPHERELRAAFRLPDPDREPDAFWLYGPPHDRKLLILWGCEFEQGASLPLLPGKGIVPGQSLLEKLQRRRMSWAAKQGQALELARRASEPLAGFVATPVFDAKGTLKSVAVSGKTYAAELVSTPRYLPAAELRRLAAAAREFYAKAHPDVPGVSAFEKELRAALRFPDPSLKPGAYVLIKTPAGPRLHVLLDGKETLPDTAPVIADDTLGLPANETDAAGQPRTPEPVVTQLQRRIAPRGKFFALAAAALVVFGAGLWFSGLFADKTAPELEKIIAENNPAEVRLVFVKPLDAASLYSPEELAAKSAANPLADPPKPHIDIRDRAGKRLPLAALALDPADPATVIVTTATPLVEDSYTLYLEGVRGRSGPALGARVEKSFDYRDRLPPKLVTVSGDSGDARRLILVFDEPLDDARATRTRNYRLQGFEFTDAQLDPKSPSTIVLTASTPFTNRERYIIAVAEVRDTSKERNEITDEITQEFVYRDTLPPRVEKVRADLEQIYLELTFSEPVAEGEAQTPGNYVLRVAGDEKPFNAITAQLVDGERTVRLRVPALENGKDYTLKVLNVTDRATPPVKIADDNLAPFDYIGTPDLEGPGIEGTPEVIRDGQAIRVVFTEPVATPAAFDKARYRELKDGFKVTNVAIDPRATDGRTVLLTPDPVLPENKPYRLVISGVPDLIGNVPPGDATSPEFARKGLIIRQTNVLGFRSIKPSLDGRTVEVEFTGEVAPVSAKDAANYALSDGIVVQSAVVDEVARSYRRVVLTLSQPLGKRKYSLTARNLARNDDPNKVQREMTESFDGPGFSDF